MSKQGNLSLVGLLLGSPVFLPPPGVARVHRLKDEDGSVQERLDRLERYIELSHPLALAMGRLRKFFSG